MISLWYVCDNYLVDTEQLRSNYIDDKEYIIAVSTTIPYGNNAGQEGATAGEITNK